MWIKSPHTISTISGNVIFLHAKHFMSNLSNNTSNVPQIDAPKNGSKKVKSLVDVLRIVAQDTDLAKQEIYIPDKCEKYGFCEGYHPIGSMLYFLADMMEE
jgi:hypothetical protein